MSIPKRPLAVSKAKKTLPLTIDWGKGIPKDRLRYINAREEGLIKAARSTTAERSHKGVKAYADDSSSSKGVTRGESPSRGADGPSGVGRGPGGGSTAAPSGSKPASSSSSPSGTGGGSKSAPSSSPASSPSKAPNAAAQAASDKYNSNSGASRASAPTNASAASVSPSNSGASRASAPNAAAAAASDRLKAMDKATAASKAQSIQSRINANTGTYPSRGDTPGNAVTDKYNRPNAYTDLNAVVHREMQDLRQPNAYVDNSPKALNDFTERQLGRFTGRTPSEIRNMAATTYGEYAGPNANERAAIANTMENRLSYGSTYGRYGMDASIGNMLNKYDANGFDTSRPVPVGGNGPFNSALAGGSELSKGLMGTTDALDPYSDFHQTAPANVQAATHYLTNDAYSTSAKNRGHWVNEPSFQDSMTQYGPHIFGNAEPTSTKIADLRQSNFGGAGLAAATGTTVEQRMAELDPPTPPPSNIPSPMGGPMMPGTPRTSQNMQAPPGWGQQASPQRLGASVQAPANLGQPPVPNDPRVSMAPGSYPAAPPAAAPQKQALPGFTPQGLTPNFRGTAGVASTGMVPGWGYSPSADYRGVSQDANPSTFSPEAGPGDQVEQDGPVYSDNPIQGPSNPMQDEGENPQVKRDRQEKYASRGATIGGIIAGPIGTVVGATLGWQMGKTSPQQRQAIASNPQALQANAQSINQMAEERGGKGNPGMTVRPEALKDVLTNPGAVTANPSKYTTLEQMLAALAQGIDPDTGQPV